MTRSITAQFVERWPLVAALGGVLGPELKCSESSEADPPSCAGQTIAHDAAGARCNAGFQSCLCPVWVIRVIPAIAACPVRPKSGHSATARVYEYAHYRAPLILRVWFFRLWLWLGCRAARQAHHEHRALARLAGHGHVAAHHASELAGDGEPEPRPAVAARGQGIGLGEILEQFGLLFGCHADAAVRDRKLDP